MWLSDSVTLTQSSQQLILIPPQIVPTESLVTGNKSQLKCQRLLGESRVHRGNSSTILILANSMHLLTFRSRLFLGDSRKNKQEDAVHVTNWEDSSIPTIAKRKGTAKFGNIGDNRWRIVGRKSTCRTRKRPSSCGRLAQKTSTYRNNNAYNYFKNL